MVVRAAKTEATVGSRLGASMLLPSPSPLWGGWRAIRASSMRYGEPGGGDREKVGKTPTPFATLRAANDPPHKGEGKKQSALAARGPLRRLDARRAAAAGGAVEVIEKFTKHIEMIAARRLAADRTQHGMKRVHQWPPK